MLVTTRRLVCALWLALVTCAAAQPVQPPGPEIRLGMSTALTGPASSLGIEMRDGVLAAITEANAAGGVRGSPLRLISLDDGYEPTRAAPNMRRLIDQEGVLAVIGNVGTPTAITAVPIANQSRTLLFGCFSGAPVLRHDPPERYVINYRASYAEETGAMVDALIRDAGLRPEEIAFFTQRDTFGDAGFFGGLAALQRHGLGDGQTVTHGLYERNTLAVENGLADILAAPIEPRAVIMVGAYAPCAEFIRVADEFGFHPLFLSVSFVGSQALADALGPLGDGIIVTQVVPHYESDLEIARRYREAIAGAGPDASPSLVSFEGYIVGEILIKALRSADAPTTRESTVDALEALGWFDIGLGNPLHLSPADHQASHAVWPTIIRDGAVHPFDWDALAAPPHEADP